MPPLDLWKPKRKIHLKRIILLSLPLPLTIDYHAMSTTSLLCLLYRDCLLLLVYSGCCLLGWSSGPCGLLWHY